MLAVEIHLMQSMDFAIDSRPKWLDKIICQGKRIGPIAVTISPRQELGPPRGQPERYAREESCIRNSVERSYHRVCHRESSGSQIRKRVANMPLPPGPRCLLDHQIEQKTPFQAAYPAPSHPIAIRFAGLSPYLRFHDTHPSVLGSRHTQRSLRSLSRSHSAVGVYPWIHPRDWHALPIAKQDDDIIL